jgi:hypothetical protein
VDIDVAFAEEGKISKSSRLSRARGVREAERGQVLIASAVGRHSFLTRQPKARGPDVFGREVDEVGVILAVGAWEVVLAGRGHRRDLATKVAALGVLRT